MIIIYIFNGLDIKQSKGLTVVTIVAIFHCFKKYVELKDSSGQWIVTQNLSYYANLKETWLALGL